MDPRDAVAEAAAQVSRAVGEGADSLRRHVAQRLPPPLRLGAEATSSGGHVGDPRALHVARLQDPFQDPSPQVTSSSMAGPQNPLEKLASSMVSSLSKLQGEAMAHLDRIPAEVALRLHASFPENHGISSLGDVGRIRYVNPLASIRHASPPRKASKSGASSATDPQGKHSQEAPGGPDADPKSLAHVRVPKRRTRQARQGTVTGRSNSSDSSDSTDSADSAQNSSQENDTHRGKSSAKGKVKGEEKDSRTRGGKAEGRNEGEEREGEEEGAGAGRESVEEFLASARDEPHIVRLQPWRDSPRHPSSHPAPDGQPWLTISGPQGVRRGMRGGGGPAAAMAEELSTLGLRDPDGAGPAGGGGGFWSFLPWNRGGQVEQRGKEVPGLRKPAGAELVEGFERMPEGASGAPEVFGQKTYGPVTKEELGRATWTLLHALAAQYPEKPSRQLQRDVRTFIGLLPSVYPCRICGEHFKEVLKSNPPEVGSKAELEQYMCRIHNVVNRSLNKPQFPCKRVAARWGSIECDEKACEL